MSRKIKDVPTSPLLENATDNNVGDLISRQQAIRWVKTECNPYGKPTLDFESGKKVIEHLEQMSPAQPKRGRWEEKDFRYHCSCCDGIAPKAIRWDFCPNCGADMREVTT